MMAARLSAATILFDAIFVPSASPIADEGPVPNRSDMTYRRARDETKVTFKVLIDSQQRTLTVGRLGGGALLRSTICCSLMDETVEAGDR